MKRLDRTGLRQRYRARKNEFFRSRLIKEFDVFELYHFGALRGVLGAVCFVPTRFQFFVFLVILLVGLVVLSCVL